MRRRYTPQVNHNSEFELDLAPLLAVMVKLVPVLLVSSAFAQMMIIETELPQVVKAAIERQNTDPKTPTISVLFDKKSGLDIVIMANGKQKTHHLNLTQNKEFDYNGFHNKMLEVKKEFPEVFKVQFEPGSDVSYKEIVRLMDEARKPRDIKERFPVKDAKTGQESTTDYMFPEILFGQITEG